MYKSGFVAVVGRPNVGKSTLINGLLNEKFLIVSNKPQTTRNNIRAILSRENYQIVFVDTPGIHKPKHKLGEYMVKSAKDSFGEVDVIIFITTPNKEISAADRFILDDLKNTNIPVFLIMNKIDENTEIRIAESLKLYSKELNFKEIIPISAIKNKNIDKVLELILENLEEGPKYYDDDILTDRNERFVVSEIIREKALRNLSDEIPHGIATQIIEMDFKEKICHIDAEITCEKESHKGIIIGKGGSMLKKISSSARIDIEKLLGMQVNLKVFVKVRKEWRDNQGYLKNFGYK